MAPLLCRLMAVTHEGSGRLVRELVLRVPSVQLAMRNTAETVRAVSNLRIMKTPAGEG